MASNLTARFPACRCRRRISLGCRC
jgi:hypothetical protein